MKKEELFELIGEIDERKIADAGIEAPRKKPFFQSKSFVAAACLCFAVLGALLIRFAVVSDSPRIIRQFSSSGESYRTPIRGECFCFSEVNEARAHYENKDVRFLLAFDIFQNGDPLTKEEKTAEYRRLHKLGYTLYQSEYWEYRSSGEKVYHSIVVGLFSEREIATFDARADYGYAFRFVVNGDGTPISIENRTPLTEF